MAVSIAELIAQKEDIAKSKKAQYDIETSLGTLTVKKPTQSFISEMLALKEKQDEYLILNMVVEPDLRDTQLQKAYECLEPTDIVGRLFDGGEIVAISKAIMKTAGYKSEDLQVKLHDTVKN